MIDIVFVYDVDDCDDDCQEPMLPRLVETENGIHPFYWLMVDYDKMNQKFNQTKNVNV